MFNSTEEKINLLNSLMEECVTDGGDAGGAYLINEEAVEKVVNILLEKMELTDSYKIITAEREFKHTSEIFRIYPKIVPIDYDINHPEWDTEEKTEGWNF